MEYPNWFMPYAQPLFEKHLLPLAGRPGLRFLQIGAYTGDASLWMLRNVLTGDGSTLTDVDTWLGSDEAEHGLLDWADVEKVYDERTRGFAARGRLTKFKGSSTDFYTKPTAQFDFVYVDGDHAPKQVFADGRWALGAVKPGGLLAFDDYTWVPRDSEYGPGIAVDNLSKLYRLSPFELGAQAWFQL